MRSQSVIVLLTLLCVVAFAVPAFAESMEEMLTSCKLLAEAKVEGGEVSFPRDYPSGMCWGAFSTLQRVIVMVDNNMRPYFHVCAPKNSTRSQLIAVFVEYSRRNPQRLHEDFFIVAIEALSGAFPCQPLR